MNSETNSNQPKGRLFAKSDIDHFRSLRHKHYESSEGEKNSEYGVRRAEEFSREIIEQLLSVPDCTGLALCYGAAPETDHAIDTYKGTSVMPRLFIVPVDENGKHLTFAVKVDGHKDGGRDFGGAGGGMPCPPATGCEL
jgi:hypothetical protein